MGHWSGIRGNVRTFLSIGSRQLRSWQITNIVAITQDACLSNLGISQNQQDLLIRILIQARMPRDTTAEPEITLKQDQAYQNISLIFLPVMCLLSYENQ